MISIFEPTPGQAALQVLQQGELKDQEKARIDHRRKEQNLKTKVSLTQTKKVLAEKFFSHWLAQSLAKTSKRLPSMQRLSNARRQLVCKRIGGMTELEQRPLKLKIWKLLLQFYLDTLKWQHPLFVEPRSTLMRH